MCEFFNSWRRKIGVMTLGLACVFTAGWVRSQSWTDVLDFGDDLLVASIDSRLAGVIRIEIAERKDRDWHLPEWETEEYFELESELDDNEIWIWRCAGLGFAFALFGKQVELIGFAPYWSIVLPLTLIAAYLLLNKPRPTTIRGRSPPPEPDHA